MRDQGGEDRLVVAFFVSLATFEHVFVSRSHRLHSIGEQAMLRDATFVVFGAEPTPPVAAAINPSPRRVSHPQLTLSRRVHFRKSAQSELREVYDLKKPIEAARVRRRGAKPGGAMAIRGAPSGRRRSVPHPQSRQR